LPNWASESCVAPFAAAFRVAFFVTRLRLAIVPPARSTFARPKA
jgi:hypothetical protein